MPPFRASKKQVGRHPEGGARAPRESTIPNPTGIEACHREENLPCGPIVYSATSGEDGNRRIMANSHTRHDERTKHLQGSHSLVHPRWQEHHSDRRNLTSNSLPIRGYGVRGKRLRAVRVHKKRLNVSTVMAMCSRGPPSWQTVEGSVNGAIFLSFCRSVFEKAPAESVVIMDNIAFITLVPCWTKRLVTAFTFFSRHRIARSATPSNTTFRP